MSDKSEPDKRTSVTICENQIMLASELARTLENLGFTVAGMVMTGEEAIRAVEEVKPDLILMDMELQGEIDGIGAVEQIRAQLDVPVIYLTDYTDRDVFERSKKTAPYGYLRKSAAVLEIESTIDTALKRYKADREVSASEALRAKAEDLAGLYRWEYDIPTGHIIWSDNSYRVLGLSRGPTEPTYDSFLNVVDASDKDLVKSALRDALNGVRPYDLEFQIVRPDGQKRVLFSRGKIQRDVRGQPVRMQVIGMDITDRKKAEEAHKRQVELLFSIFDCINEEISIIDAKTYEILYVSKFMSNRQGRDLVGDLCYKALYGSKTPCGHCAKEAAMELGSKPYRWSYHDPSSNRDYLVTDHIIKWIDGRDAIFHLSVDVTDLRITEKALRASQAQLTNAVEMAHLGHWELDVIKNEFTFNDQFYKLFRTTVEAVGGHTMPLDEYARRFVHPDEISVVGDETRKAIETDDPFFSRELEHRIVYADGEIGHISVRFFIVKDDLGRTVRTYGVNQDITQRKRWEELQIQSARLRAVVDLAGGVAHNFNNLLQIVIGNLELALLELESGNHSHVKEALESVLESSRLGAETVRRLQSFAGIRDHSQRLEKGVFDLSDTVRQALEMSRNWWKSIPDKNGIEVSLDTKLHAGCFVQGEKNEMFEVVVNLIKNASEALPQGGAIDVTTHVEGDYVVLKVRDTGIGMSKETLKRLFNPFFTTKAAAGSGLGLASSRKIIEDVGGEIFVESSKGKGTTFTIRLPLSEQPSKPVVRFARQVSGPTKTVLVIDDMEAILGSLKEGLTHFGHVVFTASSGEEGLAIFNENSIDLIICDLGMPRMNGWEVGRKIRSICDERHTPKTPFILLTGWGGQKTEVEKIGESGVDAVVEKPVNIANILTVIREIGEREQLPVREKGTPFKN